MLLPKFSGINGLAIGNIGLAGLGIINDMGTQDGDLCHAFLRRLNPVSYTHLDVYKRQLVSLRRTEKNYSCHARVAFLLVT